MIKRNLFFAGLSLVFGIILLNACKREDHIPPAITVLGADTLTIPLNATYTDPGVSALDAVDGYVLVNNDISPANPDVNLTGTYIVHYSAVDNSGNISNATRIVKVINQAQSIAATYSVTDTITGTANNSGIYNYTSVVSASTTVNDQLFLSNFSDLGSSVTVNAIATGDTLTIASQSPSGMPVVGSIIGNGTIVADSIKTIHYTIFYNHGKDIGSSTWSRL